MLGQNFQALYLLMNNTMKSVKFTVNSKLKLVKANTDNSARQLYNESVVKDYGKDWPLKKNVWYPINGSYGKWVLENEFPNFKGGEFINVVYI